ncbi:hypothetical protein [Psychrobacter sp. DAB_AL32B]|uniref:hypothetical protein n=1 Tax=Psychrobacter sp. DAB_AL32B TaxID=1028414 RepID=UPI000B7F7F0F|nr:hypothetical protein [Psychrobacter sp. DAB_AL32B]OXL24610.1 hypothetical protein CAN34_05510 [Psychrobacter sp. DAB_AL32B]
MAKSICTTSTTQAPTNSTLAAFKAGDSVLCPSVGNGTYKLFNKSKDCLTINIGNVECLYRADGRAYHDDCYVLPSLFHDTKDNRQAIATLYSGIPTSQSSQRTVIDTTEADDKEVILISAFDLSDIACDIESAAIVISDIGSLLGLIHYEKIDTHTAISMARLTHDATVTWYDLLQRQVNSIKETLAMTRYGKEGKQ